MKEIRLTFTTDDFGVISQILIDRGISFRVDLPRGPSIENRSPAEPSLPTKRRKPAGKVRKPAGKHTSTRAETPVSAASRLRDALAQRLPEPRPVAPYDRSAAQGEPDTMKPQRDDDNS